jgi:hypothetical protein
MLDAAALVPQFLPLTIAFHYLRMLGSVLTGVIGMGLAPFFPAVPHHLAVLGVSLQFLPVIILPALTLAFTLAANSLLRAVDGGKKRLLAVRTALGSTQTDSFGD